MARGVPPFGYHLDSNPLGQLRLSPRSTLSTINLLLGSGVTLEGTAPGP